MTSRRNFIKTVGATAAMSALYQRDLMADLLATSPSGRVLESKFKGLADIALAEAKLAGTSYADIRFTMTATPYGGTAMFNVDGGGRGGRGAGGGGGGGGGRGGGGGGGGVVAAAAVDAVDRSAKCRLKHRANPAVSAFA